MATKPRTSNYFPPKSANSKSMSPSMTRGPGGPRKYAHNVDAAREREMHLYLPYWGYSTSEKFAQESSGNGPNASRDNVLTVFAQLASLRLNAKRALISLFDRTTQHVVAEATPRLSLRGAKNDDKSLWRGVQQLPRESITMCNVAMQTFATKGEVEYFAVPNLTQDHRFQSDASVTGPPHNRFYVSVPIISPGDYVIGSIAVLDDEPRVAMTEEQTQFLQELSLTIMDHLISQRAMREEDREERMIRALGLFVQGKSDLAEGIDSRDHVENKAGNQLAEINRKLESFQLSDAISKIPEESALEAYPPDYANSNSIGQGKNEKGGVAEKVAQSSRSRSPIQKFECDESKLRVSKEKGENEQRPPLSPTTSQLQEKLAPFSVQHVLDRASCLMNQALDVEGVMFLDASVYARRQMIGPPDGKSESDPSDFEIEYETQTHWESMGAENSGPKSLVLGYSTSSSASSDEIDQQARHYFSLPGAFISHLIERYPRGKIFHIEDDGTIAASYEGLADDMSQAHYVGGKKVVEGSTREKDIRQETMDIKYLHRALPDARCIGIYPVWDFQRSRWFTVNLIWSNDPGRVLSEPKDLTYMAAFSNSVMAEVSKTDLEAADRAKGAFISSISHELRSPLHGVLGTAELLRDSVNTYTQRGLVETVHSCGRTLLDTLNHLFDYAKINTLTQPRGSGGEDGKTNRSKAKATVPGATQDQNLSSLVQEVAEGLIAGRDFLDREENYAPESRKRYRKCSQVSENGDDRPRLLTVVDIEWQENWHYSVYSAAWRRIVMNLFGNALKYTEAGYVSLFMKKDTISLHGESLVPAVRITITDSGRGMSQDYLLHGLYTPFIQEDNQSPGLGVGLSLVHQIVKSLNGKIEIRSKIGEGTEVDVVLPISGAESIPTSMCPFLDLQKRLKGKSVSFFTKSFERGDLGIKQQVFSDIKSSLTRMVQDWFDLEVLDNSELQQNRPDFLIVTEHEYRQFAHSPENSDIRQSMEPQHAYPLIVLSGHTGNWKVVKENSQDRAIFLSQPVCPKTLKKVFNYCLDNEGIEFDENAISPPLVESHEIQQIYGMSLNNLGSTGSEMDKARKDDDVGTLPNDRPNVLLVEDNPVNLKYVQIIEACVKNAKLPYKTTVNGLEALNKYKAERFDAVIMGILPQELALPLQVSPNSCLDISMPIMDGLSATREMRHFEKMCELEPTTIIILTAFLSAETQQEAAISGVNEFLTKPTPLKQLKQMLQNLPRRKSSIKS
ncbi:hypothetical protein N7481_000236 [Penicillium waksmanii]|uniref:uncharacterized protein n=1 Tax=Penicillium waksmanii TaxID=69791 RepID=UPI0025467DBA|nr:uncharacterized protein N7481_000236 [Penicillium waksmanii]KAJ5999827.1 hypothetical protein N7481_000236 [Penicillium waksmanii]